MTRELPADREKALGQIAAGWGRTATSAHPLCVCGEPIPGTDSAMVDLDGRAVPRTRPKADCPVHRS